MSLMTFHVSDISLTSSWYIKEKTTTVNGQQMVISYYTTPVIARGTRTFDLAALPAGSVIHSAALNAVRSGPAGADRQMDGRRGDGELTVEPGRIIPGGTLEIEFLFKASASGQELGYHSDTAVWEEITLTVDFTGYTACTAPTGVTLSKQTATLGETLTLSWSGARPGVNAPISGYEIHRATAADGPYSLLSSVGPDTLSAQVSAPETPGSYHFRVRALSSVSGCDSALSAAVAAVSAQVTAPTPPASLSIDRASQYPEGEAALSWTAGGDGDHNPVTGYAVYRAEQADGPFSFLKNAASLSCTVTAPQSGAYYFKVASVGQYLDSALSSAAVSLAVDMSGTSDFTFFPDPVDAGEPLTLTLLSNGDKAHALTAAVGSFSQTVEAAAGSPVVFTPPLSWLSALPESETAPMILRLTTQGGGTVIHTGHIRCPDQVAPAGHGGSAVPVSASVPAEWQVFVAGKSAARITLSSPAQAPYGAHVVDYFIEGPSVYVQGDELPLTGESPLLPAGDAVFELCAVDSRGRVGRVPVTAHAYPYAPPALSHILSLRCDAEGQEEDEGTCIRFTADLIYSPCGDHNTAACQVDFRRQGTETWIRAGEMEAGRLVFGNGGISLTDHWEIRCTVTDSLGGSAVYYDRVTRAAWELHVRRGGGAWAFGGVADMEGALKVYGNVYAANIAAMAAQLALLPVSSDSWTPALPEGAPSLAFSSARFFQVGKLAFACGQWTAGQALSNASVSLSGLPFSWQGGAGGQNTVSASGAQGAVRGAEGAGAVTLSFPAQTAAGAQGFFWAVGLTQ